MASLILGNKDLVQSLVFDAVVTKDFEKQNSPGRGSKASAL